MSANNVRVLGILLLLDSLIPEPVRIGRTLDELYSNCSLLALNAVSYKKSDDFIYAIWDSDGDDIITSVVARSNRTFIISKHFPRMRTPYHQLSPAVYLLHAKNISHFLSVFSKLSTEKWNWYPTGPFIVLLEKSDIFSDGRVPILSTVASSLYSINIYNSIILTNNKNSTIIDVYKWCPFAVTNRCGSVVNVSKISLCDGSAMLSSAMNDLFATNLPPRFPAGCTINAAAFHWPPYTYASPPETSNFIDGFNIRTMNTLAQKYDIHVNYILIDNRGRWGVLLKNDTWTGILGALQRGEADVALGEILQTPPRLRSFDSSYTGPLFMKFYLASPDKLPHWKSMLRIFPFTLWIMISASYVMTCIVICACSRTILCLETKFYSDYSNYFLAMWRIVLSMPTNVEPPSKKGRLVFLLWVVFSFPITLLYSSALLGVITTPMVDEPTICTLEEFSNSDLHLLVVPQFVQISSMMDEEFKSIISKKYNELKITDAKEIEQMILKKNFAIVDPHDHFEIVAKEKLEYIYVLDDVVRLNQGIYLRKGSIFLKYLDDVQNLVRESGLFEKWRRDLVGADKYKKHRHRKIEYRRSEVQPLTMEELSGAFYVLLFGLTISAIVVWLEKWYEQQYVRARRKTNQVPKYINKI